MEYRQPVTSAHELAVYLRRLWLFAGAGDEVVRSYGQRFFQRAFAAKRILYDQGDSSDTVYVVRSGKVRVSCLTPCGNDVTTAIVGRDQLLGEEALVAAGRPRMAQAMLLTDSVLCLIPRIAFDEMLGRDAAVAFNVARYVQAQRDEALETVVDLVSLKVPIRIRRLLQRLASEHGVADVAGTRIEIPLTHSDIASLVGSTRETVSVELGRLLRSGRLTRRDGFFIVSASLFDSPPSYLGVSA
jgi:CRP/FNR family transcriptional regulator